MTAKLHSQHHSLWLTSSLLSFFCPRAKQWWCFCVSSCVVPQISSSPGRLCLPFSSAHRLQVTECCWRECLSIFSLCVSGRENWSDSKRVGTAGENRMRSSANPLLTHMQLCRFMLFNSIYYCKDMLYSEFYAHQTHSKQVVTSCFKNTCLEH